MSKKLSKATGPKTALGKKHASQNARKKDIFTQGYLKWEDPAAKQTQMDALVKQWKAYDPSRQLILLTIEQANIQIERMMYSERIRIEGLMQSSEISAQFCMRTGFHPIEQTSIPSWYFSTDGERHKEHALYLHRVYLQARDLKDQVSDQLIAQTKTCYPDLYDYVLAGRPVTESFGTALGLRYKQSTAMLNLAVLMNTLTEKYSYYLKWAEDPERYQKIVDGLRIEQMQAGMDLEKSTRYATNAQNRIIKGFTALAALDHHERREITSQRQDLLEVDSDQSSNEDS